MEAIKKNCEERMKKTIEALKDEFAGIRTGRASPALLDKIRVDSYGQQMPLNQLATVSAPEARLLVIQPWDKALLSEIERAIQKSELGLNPSNDGKLIRISIPPLTEERRKELVKNARASTEQSRVSVRNARRDAIDELKKLKDSGTPEDSIKKSEDDIQKLTDNYIGQLNKVLEDKEKEILEV